MKKLFKNISEFVSKNIVCREDFKRFSARMTYFFMQAKYYITSKKLSEHLKDILNSTAFQVALITIVLCTGIRFFAMKFNEVRTVDTSKANILTTDYANKYDVVRTPNGKEVLLKEKEIIDGKSYTPSKVLNQIAIDQAEKDLRTEDSETYIVDSKDSIESERPIFDEVSYQDEKDVKHRRFSFYEKKEHEIKGGKRTTEHMINYKYNVGHLEPEVPSIDEFEILENQEKQIPIVNKAEDDKAEDDNEEYYDKNGSFNDEDIIENNKVIKKSGEKVVISIHNRGYLKGRKNIHQDLYVENLSVFEIPNGVKIFGNIYLKNVAKFKLGFHSGVVGNIFVIENSAIAPINIEASEFTGKIYIY